MIYDNYQLHVGHQYKIHLLSGKRLVGVLQGAAAPNYGVLVFRTGTGPQLIYVPLASIGYLEA